MVEPDAIAVLRHNILGQLTVIKNALLFVLEGHTGEISKETRRFLEEAYKRNEESIDTVLATRKASFGLKRNEDVVNGGKNG